MAEIHNTTWLSVSQVAKRLAVTRGRVHQLIDAGRLPAQRLGAQKVIKLADLIAFNAAREARGN